MKLLWRQREQPPAAKVHARNVFALLRTGASAFTPLKLYVFKGRMFWNRPMPDDGSGMPPYDPEPLRAATGDTTPFAALLRGMGHTALIE